MSGAAGVGEHSRLLRLAVRRQVAGEQDEVGLLGHRGERVRDPLAQRLGAVDVACGGDTDPFAHGRANTPPAQLSQSAARVCGRSWPRRIPSFEELVDAMKVAAATLRDAEVPYLLGGGLAGWARGGPPTEHDVDFFVRAEDAERALDARSPTPGMKPERPPEGWLLKAYDGDTLST